MSTSRHLDMVLALQEEGVNQVANNGVLCRKTGVSHVLVSVQIVMYTNTRRRRRWRIP